MSKTSNGVLQVTDFIGMRCKLVTYGPLAAVLLALGLAGCSGTNNESLTYTADRGIDNQPYPANYRPELLALLRTYLNDPTGVREAGISEPAQKEVGGRRRYVVCVRFNARGAGGSYAGVKERAGMYIDGRLDRIIEQTEDLCKGVSYASFPELEKLTR